MQFNPYSKLVGGAINFPLGTYGIEVEAERISALELARIVEHLAPQHPRLQAMVSHWNGTTDGSLRHNGIEWISPPIDMARAELALTVLYDAMDDGLFVPSVRTGIHVHVNAAPLDNEAFVQALRAYAVLEPLLFRFVGVEREQNIYCVPLYRASNEQRLWRRIAHLMRTPQLPRALYQRMFTLIRECCKYSALNISTFVRLGTFEFRHAPTFDSCVAATNWLHLVAQVAQFRLDEDATEDSLLPARDWAERLVPGLNWADYLAEVRERGLLGYANSLQPFTYKVAEWGKPAGLAFERAAMPPRPQAQRRTTRQQAFDEADDILTRYLRNAGQQEDAPAYQPTPEDLGEPDESYEHDDEEIE